jgi:hypothetical protein
LSYSRAGVGERMIDNASRVPRLFLLSPANCNGTRGAQALSPRGQSAVATKLRSADGVPIGELFSFVSGLYFRGKLTYALRFAAPPEPGHPMIGQGVHVITPNAGLRTPDTRVTAAAVRRFLQQDIGVENRAYRRPLEQSARALRREAGQCDVVLLGSIASPKYVDVLLDIFGDRLHFPLDFVGRGDMSRGGLLLRHAAAGIELPYGAVAGAVRHGRRPPKLPAQCVEPR